MSKIEDGGPAFPREDYQSDQAPGQSGMSLRDWFAGQIFASIMGSAEGLGTIEKHHREQLLLEAAKMCYESADAMIAIRKGHT